MGMGFTPAVFRAGLLDETIDPVAGTNDDECPGDVDPSMAQ